MLAFGSLLLIVQLCLDMHVVHIVLLHIRHDSYDAVSSTHWVAPQHTMGPPKQGKACGVWLSRCTNSVPTKDPLL